MSAWISEFSEAKGALKALDAAKEELDRRRDRALQYMEEREAVLGEACAYVGFGAAHDDLTEAKRDFEKAVRALLRKLGEEIRP